MQKACVRNEGQLWISESVFKASLRVWHERGTGLLLKMLLNRRLYACDSPLTLPPLTEDCRASLAILSQLFFMPVVPRHHSLLPVHRREGDPE